MNKESRLLRIAEDQQGYFTSRQAEGCGFSRSNFHRKLQSGKWSKEEVRGVYRLSNYPLTSRPELVLWMLWSADKEGNPQGVWSHETALDIHGLSDVSPSQLHMSVPKKFRKGTKIPKNLRLHFVDTIAPSDLEKRPGYRVTTPLKSLSDIIQEGSTQIEQVERAILDLAVHKSLIKGFATFQQMEQLLKLTDSKEMREIIASAMDEVWSQANQQLAEYGRFVEPYTIGLHFENRGFGTAVLCQHKSRYFLLTAGHVGRALRKAKSVRLILRFDTIRREHPIRSSKEFSVIEWDSSLDEESLENVNATQPKDLAILIPSETLIETLKLYKAFYKISVEPPGISPKDALISLGGIEATYSEEDDAHQLNMRPFAFLASDYRLLPDVDYITCPVSNHTYGIRNLRSKVIASFKGLSGAGLWKFDNATPILIGIAFTQDPNGYASSKGVRNVYFHGPHSLLSAFSTLGLFNEHDD